MSKSIDSEQEHFESSQDSLQRPHLVTGLARLKYNEAMCISLGGGTCKVLGDRAWLQCLVFLGGGRGETYGGDQIVTGRFHSMNPAYI